jgi:hypothetical protein
VCSHFSLGLSHFFLQFFNCLGVLLLLLSQVVVPNSVSLEVLLVLARSFEITTPSSDDEEHVDAEVDENAHDKAEAQEIHGVASPIFSRGKLVFVLLFHVFVSRELLV